MNSYFPPIYCTGCSACAGKCPKKCITMIADSEGFLYPQINENECIHCGLCERVCPVLNVEESRKPLQIYVGYNRDSDIVAQSSSGGIFTLLAQKIIADGGVVFGARFNTSREIVHDFVEKEEDLTLFRGSKYVQSRIGNAFHDVEEFLKKGRSVLFSGTPCQIAGLKSFLRNPYENLLTVDFICHGVPSLEIWKEYLHNSLSYFPKRGDVDISFRDKKEGWRNYSFTLTLNKKKENLILFTEPGYKNSFLRGFLANLYLRPSCHHCQVKSWKSGSDITIADAWGIENVYPELDDDKGCNSVVVLSPKGQSLFERIKGENLVNVRYVGEDFIRKYNVSAFVSSEPHKNRDKFFRYIQKGTDFKSAIDKCLSPSYWDKIRWSIKRRLRPKKNL